MKQKLLLLFALLVSTTMAWGQNYSWNNETKTLTITGGAVEGNFWMMYRGVYEGLETLVLGEGVTSIGERAFSECSSLATVTIGNSVTSIGEYAFSDCSSLATVTIGNSVTSIGSNAFYGCSSLATVTFDGESQLESIGSDAFYDCSSLATVTFDGESQLESIGSYAFNSCSSLTSVTIPNSVTSIGSSAFGYCTSLTSVDIGSGVTNIEKDAFYKCTNCTDVYCYANPTNLTWNEYVCDDFKSDGSTKCYVPNEYLAGYQTKFTGVVNVTFVGFNGFCGDPDVNEGKNVIWSLTDDALTISGTGAMTNYAYTSDRPWGAYVGGITSITIGEGVTSIGSKAFQSCTNLTSVTIGNSVTSIGNYAFYGCSGLTSVTIGNSVTVVRPEQP